MSACRYCWPASALALLLLIPLHAQEAPVSVDRASTEPSVISPKDVSETLTHKLIENLGSPLYAVRSDAADDLFAMGAKALTPLAKALDSKDAEVRARAVEILLRLRGRGFLGIGLSEDWNGEIPADVVPSEDQAQVVVSEEDKKSTEGELARSHPVVQVTQVLEHQPAGEAGIEVGDHILSVNGEDIHGMYDLMRVVILAGPSNASIVVVERNEKRFMLKLNLGRNPYDPLPPVDLMPKTATAEKKKATANGDVQLDPVDSIEPQEGVSDPPKK